MIEKGKIVVFSAASGAGKSTILNEINKKMPQLVYSISATTRAPRGEEKNGADYFFMDKDDFIAKRDQNGFVEWAEVHGNFYGTPRDFIEKNLNENKIVVMDIDVQGKVLLQNQFPEQLIGIFIEAPSFEELEARLRERATDSEEAIRVRLENAKKEQEFARLYGKYDYFVVNEKLEAAVEEIREILSGVQKI
jgi:guanylate kinase